MPDYRRVWLSVVRCGIDGRPLFPDGDANEHFLELLKSMPERFGLQIHAFVLMANHCHLQMETLKPALEPSNDWARRLKKSTRNCQSSSRGAEQLSMELVVKNPRGDRGSLESALGSDVPPKWQWSSGAGVLPRTAACGNDSARAWQVYGRGGIPGCERRHRKISKPAQKRTLIARQSKTDREIVES